MLVLPGALGAQSVTARLSGTVWDPSDNPTPGVILTAVEEGTGWQSEAVSDENGRYVFVSLRPGLYTVFTKARGYQQITRRNIHLPVNGNISESFTLDIATADETVQVEEPMPLFSSDASAILSERDLEALPMFARNPLAVAAHVPGFQASGGSEELSTSNGARRAMNRTSLDGMEISGPSRSGLEQPPLSLDPETVRSVRVITSGAKAEFGGAGGAYLGAASQAGGKDWHGNAYEYFSNKALNANEYFRRNSGLGRLNFHRNIFGGTLSGPLGGNRTLVFGHYEGSRMGNEIRRNRLVLTDDADDGDGESLNDEARAGVFQWYTPGSVTLNTYPIVPDPEDIHPLVAASLEMLPSPNNFAIGDGLNTAGYTFDNKIHGDSDRIAARVDHLLRSHHRLFLRLDWNGGDATDIWNRADAAFPNTPEGTVETGAWSLSAGSHYTVNPRMINEFRIGYGRAKTEFQRPERSVESMLIFNSWSNPLSPDAPRSYTSPFFELSDAFTHHWGRHTLKYGATLRRTVEESVDYSGLYPDITLGTGYGNAPGGIGPEGNSIISDQDRTTFEHLYNDILGRIESVGRTYYWDGEDFEPDGAPRTRSHASTELSGFVQDDWRIRPNLTLNLGLRYDLFTVPEEQNGLQLVLDPSSEIAPSSDHSGFTLVPGDSWRNRNLAQFGPRAGFAWDISGYGTFVLRGAYGIFYDRLPGAVTTLIDSNTPGLSSTVATYPNLEGGDVRIGDPGIPYPQAPAAAPLRSLPLTRSVSIAVLDPELSAARIDRFNLSLERRMTDHLVFEIGYAGARGRNLFQFLNYNQPKMAEGFLQAFRELKAFRDYGTPVPESNTLVQIFGSAMGAWEAIGADARGISLVDSGQAGSAADVVDRHHYDQYAAAGVPDNYLRQYPQFDRFMVGTDTGRSWYDSMQAGFRANAASLRMRGHYTWGKSLDTLSDDGVSLESPLASRAPKAGKAPSDFDRTHIINLTASFNVPFGRSHRWGSESSRVLDWIFGDWEVGVISLWQSGQRFSVTTGLETLYPGVEGLADFSGKRDIGELVYSPFGVLWFNLDQTGLFTIPEPGDAGNSGRNSFKGPAYFNTDMTFFKHFRVREGNRIQIRAEVYNIFNKTHFGVPIANVSDGGFGQFTSTIGSPRAIQLAARYIF